MPSNRPASRSVRRGGILAFSPLAVLAILLSLPMPVKAEGAPAPKDRAKNNLPLPSRERVGVRGKGHEKSGSCVSADPKEKSAPQKERAKEKWQRLFDGQSLGKWKVIDEFDYSRHGKVHVRDGRIVLEAGRPATGIKWTGPLAKNDYELSFEAMRVEGDDFFSAVTFPVGDAALTLVIGGWGGSTVGLSIIDGEMAMDNETCLYREFDQKRWYRIRLRVAKPRIEAWIDKNQAIDLPTEGRKFTVSWEMEPPLPFGLATWRTSGAVRDVRVRLLETPGRR